MASAGFTESSPEPCDPVTHVQPSSLKMRVPQTPIQGRRAKWVRRAPCGYPKLEAPS